MKQQVLEKKRRIKHSLLAVLLLTVLAGTSFFTYGQASDKTAIAFIEGKANKTLREAAQNGRYVFVDLQASWCGPCKALKERVFSDKKVAGFFNAHFVNISVDVEKEDGPELARKWQVEGLPTLLILDTRGNVIGKSVGYMNAEKLLAFASGAIQKK